MLWYSVALNIDQSVPAVLCMPDSSGPQAFRTVTHACKAGGVRVYLRHCCPWCSRWRRSTSCCRRSILAPCHKVVCKQARNMFNVRLACCTRRQERSCFACSTIWQFFDSSKGRLNSGELRRFSPRAAALRFCRSFLSLSLKLPSILAIASDLVLAYSSFCGKPATLSLCLD